MTALLRHPAAQFAVLLIAALALSGCGYRTETFRYRLTLEVETPEGLRSGSSVIEVRMTETGDHALVFPEASGIKSRVQGEAVAVDLPGGKVLFALLRMEGSSGGAAGWAITALDPPRPKGDYEVIRQVQAMQKIDRVGILPRTLPPIAHLPERSVYPMLVTFADITDPTSVALVDPDNLAATFGEGTTLKRITVQITDDPVTTGIEERLGWLSEEGKFGLNAKDNPHIPLGNFRGLFSSEYK